MKNCTCGALVDEGDPNGDICTDSKLYTSACEGTGDEREIRAAITLVDLEIEDILEGVTA